MSLFKIRAALETALNNMSPALATAWENTPFNPVSGVPYQQVFIDPAEPYHQEFGQLYEQSGIFQINLRYPLQNGIAEAQTRGELVQGIFKRGLSFSSDGVTVTIQKTPAIGRGAVVDNRWFLPIRIYFYAHLGG